MPAFFGTPFEENEDGKVVDASAPVHKQFATDDQGRRRFHGAFTGGFSAGYFNTVGSKEGWTPSQFKSSKNARAQITQRPEDFMDEEDLQSDIHTRNEFKEAPEFGTTRDELGRRKGGAIEEGHRDAIAHSVLASSLMEPQHSIGEKLLEKMRWRKGQGIGQRRKRGPSPSPSSAADSSDLKTATKDKESPKRRKVYGIQISLDDLREDQQKLEEAEKELRRQQKAEENILKIRKKRWDITETPVAPPLPVPSVGPALPELEQQKRLAKITEENRNTVAPEDTKIVSFKPKNDTFGVGFDPYSMNPELRRQHEEMSGGNKIRMQMGQPSSKTANRYGLGVFEDSDDIDVYDDDPKNYAKEVQSKKNSTMDEENADSKKVFRSSQRCADDRLILPGYVLVDRITYELENKHVPKVPAEFKERHQFETPLLEEIQKKGSLDARARGKLLGEQQLADAPKSIFDLLSPQDRERIEKATKELLQNKDPNAAAPRPASGSVAGISASNPSLAFASDPLKHQRYRMFLQKQDIPDHGLSKQQQQTEMEEFKRAAEALKAIPAAMQSRFTHAENKDVGGTEGDDVRKLGQTGFLPDSTKSASLPPVVTTINGGIRREECDWVPEKLLCKRFNVRFPWADKHPVLATPKDMKQVSRVIVPAEISPTAAALQFQSTTAPPPPPSVPSVPATQQATEEEDSSVAAPDLPPENRPSMDLFKMIFEEDEDEEASDSDDNMEEEK